MADGEQQGAQASQGAPAKSGGLPIKTIAMVLGLLVVEAVVVFVVVGKLGKPATVQAVDAETEAEDPGEALSEALVADGAFPNQQSGRVWSWQIEIYVQVREKHKERVEADLESRKAEIKQGINEIIRNAHHRHLTESSLSTLNRQLMAFFNEIFGTDAEGESRIERVLLPECTGFPADY